MMIEELIEQLIDGKLFPFLKIGLKRLVQKANRFTYSDDKVDRLVKFIFKESEKIKVCICIFT